MMWSTYEILYKRLMNINEDSCQPWWWSVYARYPDNCTDSVWYNPLLNDKLTQSCFSDFAFKIRIIRLGFSFQKKILYWNSQPTDSQSGVIIFSFLFTGDPESRVGIRVHSNRNGPINNAQGPFTDHTQNSTTSGRAQFHHLLKIFI